MAYLLLGLLALLCPSAALAAGKICVKGSPCYWLFVGSWVGLGLGVGQILWLGISSRGYVRRIAMLVGAINLVMGERFFSSPTYDIFYNTSFLAPTQMAVGGLCLALVFVQSVRQHRDRQK